MSVNNQFSNILTKKHIRGVRLHFIPDSYKGSPELYSDITFEKDRIFKEE
jgi:hypothetical protein